MLRLLFARHSCRVRVFLDCDQLENLDFLFDVVRTSTRNIVVVLTPELLKRVWCAGEIATVPWCLIQQLFCFVLGLFATDT